MARSRFNSRLVIALGIAALVIGAAVYQVGRTTPLGHQLLSGQLRAGSPIGEVNICSSDDAKHFNQHPYKLRITEEESATQVIPNTEEGLARVCSSAPCTESGDSSKTCFKATFDVIPFRFNQLLSVTTFTVKVLKIAPYATNYAGEPFDTLGATIQPTSLTLDTTNLQAGTPFHDPRILAIAQKQLDLISSLNEAKEQALRQGLQELIDAVNSPGPPPQGWLPGGAFASGAGAEEASLEMMREKIEAVRVNYNQRWQQAIGKHGPKPEVRIPGSDIYCDSDATKEYIRTATLILPPGFTVQGKGEVEGYNWQCEEVTVKNAGGKVVSAVECTRTVLVGDEITFSAEGNSTLPLFGEVWEEGCPCTGESCTVTVNNSFSCTSAKVNQTGG